MTIPTRIEKSQPIIVDVYDYDSDENPIQIENENVYPIIDVNPPNNENTTLNVDHECLTGPRRSERARKPKVCECCSKVVGSKDALEPNTVGEVYLRDDKETSLEAMKSEIDNLNRNKTWIVVKKPPNVKIVGSKWVFATKKNPIIKSSSIKPKARLVAQGHTLYGIDFWESYIVQF